MPVSPFMRPALVLTMLLLVAGCATPENNTTGPSPVVNPRWESCDAARAAGGVGDAPHLDDTFQPTTAVLCQPTLLRQPGDAIVTSGLELRAHDIRALVTALRLPDEKPTDGPCTTEMINLPWIALLDDTGQWIHPGIPSDACRKPRPEVRTAIAQLKTTRVAGEPPPAAQPSPTNGCTALWADMVWVTGESNSGGGTPDALTASNDTTVRVCVYEVPRGQRGGGKPAGEFQSARTLTAAQWTAVKRDLSSAPPAVPCRTPGSRFAVLHLKTGHIYVEADGCRRALIEGRSAQGALRKAGPQTTAALFN